MGVRGSLRMCYVWGWFELMNKVMLVKDVCVVELFIVLL